jgi:hypothetical protein
MGLYQILTDPSSFKFYAEKSFPNVNAVSTPNSFGQKSIGYGNGNQPYIKIPIPGSGVNFAQLNLLNNPPTPFDLSTIPNIDKISKTENNLRYNPSSWGLDFLNRGNAFGLLRASDDVLRLTKFFTDTKSATGALFIAKQNLLSRVAPKTEASFGIAYGLGTVNSGIYTPLSTIGQAAVSVIEGNLLKQGIDPTGTIESLSIRNYQQAIAENQLLDNSFETNNRLIKLSKLSYITVSEADGLNAGSTYKLSANTDYFMSYGGGPSSFLGVGNTKIKYATNNLGTTPLLTLSSEKEFSDRIASSNYSPIPLTWNRKELAEIPSQLINDSTPTISEDFRKPLIEKSTLGQQIFLSSSPSYRLDSANTGNIEKRINFRGAGARGNRKNYKDGKKDITAGRVLGPTDLINAAPIYQREFASNKEVLKDLIDFRIGIYDNDTIGFNRAIKLNWLHFRVLLDEFSDSYGADWKPVNYMGRAESFYKYDSFKRDVSIGFTVAAQSKEELLPIYKKLNYLASSLAPSYSNNGFIRGNLSRITLGNWLYEQPGFISSVDLSIPEESPWEINLPLDGQLDPYVKQVPHMVQVKIKFTPIHRFRPEITKLGDLPNADEFTENNIMYQNPTYGPQRYIALEDQTGPQSTGYDIQPQPTPPPPPGAAQSTQQQNDVAYGPVTSQEASSFTSPFSNGFFESPVSTTSPSAPANPDLALGNQGSIFIP